jgi:hypothetical protein
MRTIGGLVLAVAACTVPLVGTVREPIRWVKHGRHGWYEKGGAPLTGLTCGEQYERAVAGVPRAEELVASCRRDVIGYGAGMLGFLVFPVAGLTTYLVTDSGPVHRDSGPVGVGLGGASFLVGMLLGYLAEGRLYDAVHVYDDAIGTVTPERNDERE